MRFKKILIRDVPFRSKLESESHADFAQAFYNHIKKARAGFHYIQMIDAPTKHTPGDWKLSELGHETMIHGLSCVEVNRPSMGDNLGEWICYVRGNTVLERTANARLIASAPKMLEALEHLLAANANDSIWNYPSAWENARQVIKEAKGEQ